MNFRLLDWFNNCGSLRFQFCLHVHCYDSQWWQLCMLWGCGLLFSQILLHVCNRYLKPIADRWCKTWMWLCNANAGYWVPLAVGYLDSGTKMLKITLSLKELLLPCGVVRSLSKGTCPAVWHARKEWIATWKRDWIKLEQCQTQPNKAYICEPLTQQKLHPCMQWVYGKQLGRSKRCGGMW